MCNPDHQAYRPTGLPSFDGVQKLLPQREDFLCVAERHATHVRQHEITSLPCEQLLAENLFEPMDLAADRGVRQPELLARPDNASLLRDDPEVEEVVVVEPFHTGSIRRFLLRLILKLPNSRIMRQGLEG